MYLFYETEANTLPPVAPTMAYEQRQIPQLLRLTWLHTDGEGVILHEADTYVKPIGFRISKTATLMYNLSQDWLMANGKPMGEVLEDFSRDAAQAQYAIVHGLSMHGSVVSAAYKRAKMADPQEQLIPLCTADTTISYCGLTKPDGSPKAPSLFQLAQKVLDTPNVKLKTPQERLQVLAEAFFALRDQKVLALP